MTRTISKDTLRKKVSGIADDDRREAASAEARKRWEEMRTVLAERADTLSDAAEEQWEHARDSAKPQVKRLKRRAADARDAVDNALDPERLRDELSGLSSQLGRNLAGLGIDLKDATRTEADRIIGAIQDAADEAREQERKRRVRALIGWTAFGMVAGAVLAMQFGPKGRDDDSVDASSGSEESAVAGEPDPEPVDEGDPAHTGAQADVDEPPLS